MLNYIKSEIYRNLCKKSTYIFAGMLVLLSISVNVFMAIMNTSRDPSSAITTLEALRIIPVFIYTPFMLTFFIASMFFSEDRQNMSIKNSIGFGIGRIQIFFGKFIVELVYCLIICVIIFGVYIGSAYLLLANGDTTDTTVVLNQLLQSILYSLPLWIGGLAVSNALCFIFKHTRVQVSIFLGIFVALPIALQYMGIYTPELRKILNYTPLMQMSLVTRAGSFSPNLIADNFTSHLVVGMFYVLIAFVAGILLFRKAEVK